MANKIQIRRGIRKDLPEHLLVGEFALCTDTKEVFIGTENGNLKMNEPETISGDLNILGDLLLGTDGDNDSDIRINKINAVGGLNISSGKDISLVAEENLVVKAEYGNMTLDSSYDLDINADDNIKFDAGSTFDITAKRIEAHTESGIKMTTDGSFTFAAGEGAFDVSTETVSIGAGVAELRGGDLSLAGSNKTSIKGGKKVEVLSDDNMRFAAPDFSIEAGYNLALSGDKTKISGDNVDISSLNGLNIQGENINAKSLKTMELDGEDISVNSGNNVLIKAVNDMSLKSEESFNIEVEYGGIEIDSSRDMDIKADDNIKVNAGSLLRLDANRIESHTNGIYMTSDGSFEFYAGEGDFKVGTESVSISGGSTELRGGELLLKAGSKMSIASDKDISVVAPENMLVDVDNLNMHICCDMKVEAYEAIISASKVDINSSNDLVLDAEDIYVSSTDNISFIAGEGYFEVNSENFKASSKESLSLDSSRDLSISVGKNIEILSHDNMNLISPCLNIEAGCSLTLSGDKTTINGDNIDISAINALNLSSKDDMSLESLKNLVLKSEDIQILGTVHNLSDERDKADIRPTELGLDFIRALKPVDFKWDYRDDYYEIRTLQETEKDADGNEKLDGNGNRLFKTERVKCNKDGSKKRKSFHHGLIAQDVKKIIDETGVEFGGFKDHSASGGNDVLTISYEELIAPMIKAIQEQAEMIQELKNKVATLEKVK